MGIDVLFDSDHERACLTCATTGIAFGRVFRGVDAGEKLEGFLQWYAVNGAHRDPRIDPAIGDVQDAWLAQLDDGCEVCGAEPWEPCDDEIVSEHARKFTRCAKHRDGCRHQARYSHREALWCSAHAPRGAVRIAEAAQ